MEFLTAIVSEFVGIIAVYTIEPLGRQVGYLIYYKSNLQNLRNRVENLNATKDRMQHMVDEVKRKGKRVQADVEKWLLNVDLISGEVYAFLEDERHRKTKYHLGLFLNPILSYQLSKESLQMAQKVEFHEKIEFPRISYNVSPQEICGISSQDYLAFESRISLVKEIMEELRNPGANIIGVYGMGGVGKTTLSKEVFRQAMKEKLFDDVVIVLDVNHNPDLKRIQKEIAEKLGMDVLEAQTIAGRACHLYERIKDKKILVILDDVWGKLDLEAVGLPRVATCNILLTSRSREVLSSEMHTQKEFRLEVLNEEEAWRLFEKVAGAVVKDNLIRKVAFQVAKHCGGLPILVVAVASALKSSALDAWKDALRRLKRFEKKGLTEKGYLALEWSYNQLDDEELKPLFLLCGVMANSDYNVSQGDLLKYSIGLGLLKNVDTVEEAQNALNSLVKRLKDSCLLLDGAYTSAFINPCVRMHELVRNVAIRIASRDQHVLLRTNQDELKEWPNQDFFEKCTMVYFHFCSIPKFSILPWKCRKLKMFYLGSSDILLELPCNFFEEMTELKVLDLTGLCIPSLPSSLGFLKNLQTLCLDRCVLGDIALVGQLRNLKILSFFRSQVKEVPKEIGQLTHLKLLEFTSCSELVLISPGVISNLKNLEALRMGMYSFNLWETEGVTGSKRNNASLSELKHLVRLTALDIHIPDAEILPPNLFPKLDRYHIVIGDAWGWSDFDKPFKTLKLKLATSNQLDKALKMLLKSSEHLYLDIVEGVTDIFNLLDNQDFQQLRHFHVQNNGEVTSIIEVNSFTTLQSLCLYNLGSLESVYYGQRLSLEHFQNLKSLTLSNLPKLVGFFSRGQKPAVTTRIEEVEMPNLTTLIVHRCDGLKFLFSPTMARSLVQLKHLEISRCQTLKEIVLTKEPGEEYLNNIFCKLNHLQLHHLPNLTRFSSGSYMEFQSLETLHLEDCTKLERFIAEPITSEERDSKENLNTSVQCFLFDKKVGFPSLERLIIYDLPKFVTIWHTQLAPDSFFRLRKVNIYRCPSLINIFAASIMGRLNALDTLEIWHCKSLQVVFELGAGGISTTETFDTTSSRLKYFEYCQNLDLVDIDSCEILKSVFPASVAKGLQQLRVLSVDNCGLVEIIEEEEGQETITTFVFPKVKSVILRDLCKLRSFYPAMHTSKWPLLEDLKFVRCHNMEIFAPGISRAHEKLKLVPLFEKDAFSNLENLTLRTHTDVEIWCDLLPADFFSNLKSLVYYSAKAWPAAFLKKLNNLEKLELYGPAKEICVPEGNGNEKMDAGRIRLRHLRSLELVRMPMLMHLGKGNCHSADPIFPNLEILDVWLCGTLKSLRSSAISFQNLTTLKVTRCQRLEYLITHSMTKSFVQLTHMEVKDCSRVVEIVAFSNEDDAGNDISFSRLQHLELSDLPSLHRFCRYNCTVKMPTLDTLRVTDCLVLLTISPDGILVSDSEPGRVQRKRKRNEYDDETEGSDKT